MDTLRVGSSLSEYLSLMWKTATSVGMFAGLQSRETSNRKGRKRFLGDLAEPFAPCAIKPLSRLLRSRPRITAYTYCKLSCVSFTAQRAFEQLPTLTTPWVLKYILEACPAVLVLSTIIPLTPPG